MKQLFILLIFPITVSGSMIDSLGVDTEAPQPMCVPAVNVTLATDGSGLIQPSMSFFVLNQNIDNCTPDEELIVSLSIYRDGTVDSTITTDPVYIDCDDIDRQVDVLAKIEDLAGNFSFCSFSIIAKDQSVPQACPNVPVYDLFFLSPFIDTALITSDSAINVFATIENHHVTLQACKEVNIYPNTAIDTPGTLIVNIAGCE